MKIDPTVSVVTGGGSGVGAETAKMIVQRGGSVVIAERVAGSVIPDVNTLVEKLKVEASVL